MPRHILKLNFDFQVLDENRNLIDGGFIKGEIAINSKSAGVVEIVDSATRDYSADVAEHVKAIFTKANKK